MVLHGAVVPVLVAGYGFHAVYLDAPFPEGSDGC